jgi:hypothetical protein
MEYSFEIVLIEHFSGDHSHLHLITNNCFSSNENLHHEISEDPMMGGQNPIDKLYSMTQNAYYCSAC